MKILVTTILFFVLTVSNALGTAQYPDKIIYDGKEYDLFTNPMEAYFSKYPEKRPKSGGISTALWRGYVATFEVKDKVLILKDIQIQTGYEKGEQNWRSEKGAVVPEGQSLQIDWFTGILCLPFGERVKYVHMGYGSTYSNYILLEVKKGKITGERKLDGKQYEVFREKQFQAFKKTEEYKETVARMKNSNDSLEFIDGFLRVIGVEYTTEFIDDEGSLNKSIDGSKK
ncbi:hypothetical protein A2223_00075 [Candidatus Falkowbacteria bacterium RIFOXYA2_FULL_35_8]|nr:MAG: hypothetical protein A2223_00075 [Candidatus Falkowbacteria bacterium RIFOXYA2_FULL_35_8]